MSSAYEVTLRWAMKHHLITMGASVVVLALTVYVFGLVPKGFIPSEDTGQILINTEAAQGISYEQMVKYQSQLAVLVAKDPNVENFFSSVGTGGIGLTGNTGRIFIKLKPRKERTKNADDIIREIRPKLTRVPGIRVSLQNPPVIRVGGRLSRSLYQFTLQSPEAARTLSERRDLRRKTPRDSGFHRRRQRFTAEQSALRVIFDRDKASTMGVTAQGISARQVEEASGTPMQPGRSPQLRRRTTSTRWCWRWTRNSKMTRPLCRC